MEMDNSKSGHCHHQLKIKKPSKGKTKPIKIRYISSPVMVWASNASEFRAIVQELTGRNSDLGKIGQEGGVATSDGIAPVVDLGTQEKEGFRDGKSECSNMVALEFDQFFWRELSKSSGFEIPWVLV
ncbi:hypothetical protein U1Q18_014889 [Sarracenia purpurea var. burkii]